MHFKIIESTTACFISWCKLLHWLHIVLTDVFKLDNPEETCRMFDAELDFYILSTLLPGLVELHILCKLLPNLECGSARLALLLCL